MDVTAAAGPSSAAAAWDVEHLDLEAYQARLGLIGSVPRGEDALRRLHRAHVAAIPFENVDVLL